MRDQRELKTDNFINCVKIFNYPTRNIKIEKNAIPGVNLYLNRHYFIFLTMQHS